jgi:Domain of unknown function (DUF4157)
VQRKLAVGAADDPVEVEADRAADDVMRILRSLAADGSAAGELTHGRPTRVRRHASPDIYQERPADGLASGPEVGMAGGGIAGELSSRITRASGGVPLGERAMSRMEHGFGISFADVRIHAESDLPRQIAADAFTAGSHLHFAPGVYDPSSSSGERLLAHELAHVVQQGGSRIARHVCHDGCGHEAVSSGGNDVTNPAVVRQEQKHLIGGLRPSVGDGLRIARRFNQAAVGAQTEHFNGVTATYVAAANSGDIHIAVGANDQGTMAQDALRALWAIKDELRKGEARTVPVPGRFEMHPQGAVVVKDTMEMLGEAFGVDPSRGQARHAKANRKQTGLPLTQPQMGGILDPLIVPEHIHYRDSLVGSGISMGAIGQGMAGGAVDMLDSSAPNALAAANERNLYDTALGALQPLSLNVSMTLTQLETLISSLERNVSAVNMALLKAKHFWSY